MNKQDKKQNYPDGWHTYDLEVLKHIDHAVVMLQAIRQHYVQGIEMNTISVQAQDIQEVLTQVSNVPSDPVGTIATDPRRKIRRDNLKKTRGIISKAHSLIQEALHYSAKAAL
jgi:hypothetical protein